MACLKFKILTTAGAIIFKRIEQLISDGYQLFAGKQTGQLEITGPKIKTKDKHFQKKKLKDEPN